MGWNKKVNVQSGNGNKDGKEEHKLIVSLPVIDN